MTKWDVFFFQDLKLKFYDMMIQYALQHSEYLDATKYYHKVWDTPAIKADVNGRGREVSLASVSSPVWTGLIHTIPKGTGTHSVLRRLGTARQ